MDISFLLPAGDALKLVEVSVDDPTRVVTLVIQSVEPHPLCPACGQPASKTQSRYVRTMADLPWADCAVRIQFHVRRFFCPTDTCSRRIFAERINFVL